MWECCKDDRQSQWGMAKFDPQPTLNPLTDRHQIWYTSLRRGCLLPKKIWAQSAPGVLSPTYPKYTPKFFECLLHFFQFFRRSTDALVGPIFMLNTSFDVDLRKVVPFGVRKFKIKIWLSYQVSKVKILQWRLWGNLKIFQTVITPVVCKTES